MKFLFKFLLITLLILTFSSQILAYEQIVGNSKYIIKNGEFDFIAGSYSCKLTSATGAFVCTGGFSVPKSSGTAGSVLLYESYSTSTNGVTISGPNTGAQMTSYGLTLYSIAPLLGQIPMVSNSSTPFSLAWTPNEINGSAGASPTTVQLSGVGAYIYNTGQTTSQSIILPVGVANLRFTGYIGTAPGGTYYWKFTANGVNRMFLNGTAGTVGQSIIRTTPVVGEDITCYTARTNNTGPVYDWYCKTQGTWTQGP